MSRKSSPARPRVKASASASGEPEPASLVSPKPLEAPRAASIREEINLLDRARAGLRIGDRRQAQTALDEYYRRFPKGELRSEADIVRRNVARVTP
jgi:hypothetical protein